MLNARAARGAAPLLLCAALACGVLLYRPWLATPFGINDFSEFLPLIEGSSGFATRLHRLVGYYQEHGRFNLVAYAGLLAKWQLFGMDSRLWQLARTVQMMAIVVATFALVRRMGAGALAAAAGAALIVVGTGGSTAWTWLTTGEPLATLLVLAAAHSAVRLQDSPRWRLHAAVIAACAAAIVLTKEVLVVIDAFPVVLLLTHPGRDGWTRGSPSRRRAAATIGAVAVATVAALVPVLLAMRQMRSGGYVSNYDVSSIGVGVFVRLVLTMLFPIRLEASIVEGLRAAALLGNALFAVMLLFGWGVGLRAERRGAVARLVAAASLPLSLALVYLPWPVALDIYLLPALVGDAMLLAFAFDYVARYAREIRRATAAAYALTWIAAALIAWQHARQAEALRIVDAEVVGIVQALAARTAVVVTRPAEDMIKPPNQWMGKGPALGRDAAAMSRRTLLPVTDAACELTLPLVRRGIPVFVFDAQCGPLPAPTVAFRSYYRYLDLRPRGGGVAVDSVRADLLLPAAGREGPPARE